MITAAALRLATAIGLNYAGAGLIDDIAEIAGDRQWALTAEDVQALLDSGEVTKDPTRHEENVSLLMQKQLEKIGRIMGLTDDDATHLGKWGSAKTAKMIREREIE